MTQALERRGAVEPETPAFGINGSRMHLSILGPHDKTSTAAQLAGTSDA